MLVHEEEDHPKERAWEVKGGEGVVEGGVQSGTELRGNISGKSRERKK